MRGAEANVEIVIAGAGILGTVLAAILSMAYPTARILCLRRTDVDLPHAESLRNQGWAQAGMRYLDVDPVAATGMILARKGLFEFAGLPTRPAQGIVQMDPAQEEEFLKLIEDGPFRPDTDKMSASDAQRHLSSFWDPRAVCYWVPEYHLDIPRVMQVARGFAIANQVEFREIGGTEVVDPMTAAGNALLRVDGQEIAANLVIFTAGCGNIPIMDKLKVEHRFKLRQTPLIVTRGDPLVKAPVMYDRKNKLSIVSHRPCQPIPQGCMIIGTKMSHPIEAYCEASERLVRPEDAEAIYRVLEHALPDLRLDPRSHKFTAGWEPIPHDKPHFKHNILDFPDRSDLANILVGFPGRATVALDAAEEAKRKVAARFEAPRERLPMPSQLADLGHAWRADIHMHFYDYYRSVSDYYGSDA